MENLKISIGKLYHHQVEAVSWMWFLHQKNKGGVLGDDKGFSNTLAFVVFISRLFEMGEVKKVLIVTPAKRIQKWEDEFQKSLPLLKISIYSKKHKKDKRKVLKEGRVLITSFQNFVTSSEEKPFGSTYTWDYVIFDDAHRILNKNLTSTAADRLPAKHKIIRTEYPIQNHLDELWTAFNICHGGKLLVSEAEFKTQYKKPIEKGAQENASSDAQKYARQQSEALNKLIAPYYLRRTKDPSSNEAHSLPPKMDIVLWVYLSDLQVQIYRQYLESEHVKEIMNTRKRTCTSELEKLRNICDHPRLFTELDMETNLNQEIENPLANVDSEVLLKESGKLETLFLLLENLIENKHRILVFANKQKTLDIIEKILLYKRWRFIRLCGTIRDEHERQQLIWKFQNNTKYSVLLLMTQMENADFVLTAADRIVFYSPEFNNVVEQKAVRCAYQNGQSKHIFVYRIITCAAVEEKIFKKQIMKNSITRQFSGMKPYEEPHRLFKDADLNNYWVLGNTKISETHDRLGKLGEINEKTTPELEEHLAFLRSFKSLVYGISNHDLVFKDAASAANHIRKPVETAEEQNESEFLAAQFNNVSSIASDSATNITPSPPRRKNQGESDKCSDQGKENYLRPPVAYNVCREPGFEKTFRIEEEITREPLRGIAQSSMKASKRD